MEKVDYLRAMEIDCWEKRSSSTNSSTNTESNLTRNLVEESSLSNNWQELADTIANCTKCELHKSRRNTVFGIGDPNADLLIIGEAPGATEDAQGEPFVGRAGKLLDNMLLSIGLQRSNIFIANILKCRPPQNRDPSPKEVATCTPYLTKQIEHIKPKLIVTVGRIAAHFLLNTNLSMAKLRGHSYEYGENKTPLLVTYHPAYLLRSPGEKAKAYQDLQLIKSYL
ncbi:MAG: uracil-DNA glycosylase [Gammaproteobacteria bacterium]|nr:uracil-DNA glycosylase [Gammaproteobacteria bacterium]